jgi:hypothetical protein
MNYYNYFTEIEEHFARRRGKHLLVSPMDWSLIDAWRTSGVPLHVALRGIDRAIDSFHARVRRPTARVNSLFYCHDAVMQEYANYLESRLGDQSSASPADPSNPVESNGGPDKKTILEFLTSRISEIKELRVKHYEKQTARLTEGLDRVRARLEEIAGDLEAEQRIDCESLERDLVVLDDALLSELSPAISQEEMAGWNEEARKELKVYRKKLPKETYQKIQNNFLRKRIHQHFGIGELSLFHL